MGKPAQHASWSGKPNRWILPDLGDKDRLQRGQFPVSARVAIPAPVTSATDLPTHRRCRLARHCRDHPDRQNSAMRREISSRSVNDSRRTKRCRGRRRRRHLHVVLPRARRASQFPRGLSTRHRRRPLGDHRLLRSSQPNHHDLRAPCLPLGAADWGGARRRGPCPLEETGPSGGEPGWGEVPLAMCFQAQGEVEQRSVRRTDAGLVVVPPGVVQGGALRVDGLQQE